MKKMIGVVGLATLSAFVGCKKSPSLPPSGALSGGAQAAIAPTMIRAHKDPNKKYFPEGSPTRAIQDLDDQLESYVLNPKTPEDQKYNEDLKKEVLHGTFDIGELCRLSMAQHWGEISGGEQGHFTDLMTRLLEKKAVFSKEQGGKKSQGTLYFVSYEGDKFLNSDQSLALVRTAVNIPSESMKIDLNYKLKKAGSAWKIYDVIVDDASLLDNYKFQFDKIIKKDGFPTLVHRMESKLQELESKSG